MRGGRARAVALAGFALLAAACGSSVGAGAPTPKPSPSPDLGTSPHADTLTAPSQVAGRRVRFFVASEMTQQVWVLEGEPLAVVARIQVGKLPHNIGVSPDAKWVAVANRMGSSVSVIDPRELKEIARVNVGKQPHDLVWAPDASMLFVGSEREPFIHRVEAGTWKALPPLSVQVPQHTLAIWKDRPNELWYTATNVETSPHLRVYHLDTNKITPVQVHDVHDIFFTPDGSELWNSSSGFLCKRSDRVIITDALEKKPKQELHFPGSYPFHSMKQNRDALFFVDQTETMVLSDHQQEALHIVDWRERKIVGTVKLKDPSLKVNGSCGIEPFHTTYTPGRYYATSNKDNSLRVIDAKELKVLQRVEITTPHGVVLVPLD